jgi:hypothetical protein
MDPISTVRAKIWPTVAERFSLKATRRHLKQQVTVLPTPSTEKISSSVTAIAQPIRELPFSSSDLSAGRLMVGLN